MKLKPVNLKNHPDYSEKWLQDQIAEDPSEWEHGKSRPNESTVVIVRTFMNKYGV